MNKNQIKIMFFLTYESNLLLLFDEVFNKPASYIHAKPLVVIAQAENHTIEQNIHNEPMTYTDCLKNHKTININPIMPAKNAYQNQFLSFAPASSITPTVVKTAKTAIPASSLLTPRI